MQSKHNNFVFLPIINPLYEKTGTDHGSHIGHRTRHGAPARGRRIRHNGDGTRRRTARKRSAAKSKRRAVAAPRLVFDAQREAEVRKFLSPLERVDLLINNAGLAAGWNTSTKATRPDWDAMIDTNVKGLLYVTRVVTPKWLRAAATKIQHRARFGHRKLTKTARSTAPRNTPCTPFRSSCAPTRCQAELQVDVDLPRHGRDRIFSSELPRRQEGRADRVYDGVVSRLRATTSPKLTAWAAQLPAHM